MLRNSLSIPFSIAVVGIIVGVLIFIFPSTFDRLLTYVVAGLIIAYDVVNSTWLAVRRRKLTKIYVDAKGISVIKGGAFRRKEFIPVSKISVVRQHTNPLDDRMDQLRITVVSASKEIELPPLSAVDGRELMSLLEKGTDDAA